MQSPEDATLHSLNDHLRQHHGPLQTLHQYLPGAMPTRNQAFGNATNPTTMKSLNRNPSAVPLECPTLLGLVRTWASTNAP